jgi:hypothetical protein
MWWSCGGLHSFPGEDGYNREFWGIVTVEFVNFYVVDRVKVAIRIDADMNFGVVMEVVDGFEKLGFSHLRDSVGLGSCDHIMEMGRKYGRIMAVEP